LTLQRRVRADGSLPIRRFVGMFFQGNPVMAAESLLRYGRAGDEPSRVHMIGRLARSGSPLSEDELIEALQDPSFQVRYEAITAIARRRCGARLTGEVIETLISGQPDMSVAAAWALSRSASPSALAPLRWTFSAGSPLLRLRSARALASLGDQEILPELERLSTAQADPRLQQAYQSVLAGLRRRAAGRGGLPEGPRPPIKCQMKHVLAALRSDDCDLRCQGVVLASQLPGRPELIDALIDLLERGEVDLSLEAAWALSRIGDQRAVPALLNAFNCDYPLLSARAARALAHLGCRQIVPELCRRLEQPGEIGVQIAYAAALGGLRATQALPAVLALYARVPNQSWARELDLAVARLIGQERPYIQLWRKMRKDRATQAARALHPLVKTLQRRAPHLADSLRICLGELSDQNLSAGCVSMAGLLAGLPHELLSPQSSQVRDHCRVFLTRQGPMQAECLPLAIACLKSALG
jgi:HEAT repeat protein